MPRVEIGRGRKRTPKRMQKRLATIDEALPTADPLSRVQLIQERYDLKGHLASGENQIDRRPLRRLIGASTPGNIGREVGAVTRAV